jgi:hypothetical protein
MIFPESTRGKTHGRKRRPFLPGKVWKARKRSGAKEDNGNFSIEIRAVMT